MGPIGFSFLVIWNWAVKVWSLRWQWSSLNSPMRWLKLVKSREKLPANRSYAERSWVAQVSWSTSRSKGAEWLVERQEWETTGVCGWRGGYCSLDTWFPLLLLFVLVEFVSFTSVQFNHSVVSNSLQPHGLQHVRLPCPSPTPGACSNSCPSTR